MSTTPITPSSPTLVIDGSSTGFFSGVLGSDGRWLASIQATEPALESLFETVDAVLERADLKLEQIQSYNYCEGPGSVLGLRLCAMAIKTWKHIHSTPVKLYAYNSLQLTGANLLHEKEIKEEVLLISDWKKDTWNSLKIRPGLALETITPISTAELSEWHGELYHLPARKGWQTPPANAIELAYDPENLAKLQAVPGLLKPSQNVELYNSGINTFQKWTPDRHRAAPEQHPGGHTNQTAS